MFMKSGKNDRNFYINMQTQTAKLCRRARISGWNGKMCGVHYQFTTTADQRYVDKDFQIGVDAQAPGSRGKGGPMPHSW